MATTAIHVRPDEAFDDWILQNESGRELGHFGTREAAELAARAIAQQFGDELVIHLPDGRTTRERIANG